MGDEQSTRLSEREPAGSARTLVRPAWTLLVSGDVTGGAFELFEETRATNSGPPPHVHRNRDETFYVVEGRYVFMRGNEEVELEQGNAIFIPRGQRHWFRTLTEPSRTLIIVAPAGLEDFFRQMGVRMSAGETAFEAMTALAASHDAHPVE